MEKEYRLNLFAKIFYGALTAGTAIFLVYLTIFHPPNDNIVYLIIALPIIVCVLTYMNIFVSKVIVTATSITRQRMFYNKTLNFDEIKGVRIESKIIVIEPQDATLSKLKISNYDDLADSEELTKWLRATFVDLDKEDLERERNALLKDNTLGLTIEERESKINKMRQIAIAYNIGGFIMTFLLIFIRNSSLSFWTGALYPLLGIVIIKFSKGLIKFIGESQRSLHSGVSLGISMSIINVFILAIAEYEVLSFTNAIPIISLLAVALFILFYSVGINNIKGVAKGQVVGMVIISVLYAFGNTIVANCLFDKSTPVNFQTYVVDEYISSGKGAHYHLKLNPWKANGRIREVDVSKTDYERAPIGSPVIIYEKKGWLNIPWFDYDLNPTPPVPAGSGSGNSPNPK